MKIKTKLLEKQREAYNKLSRLKVGALYMDMGTGKTRTMLEIIKNKVERKKAEKVLWFCPCSAKENIRRDLEKHLLSDHDRFLIIGLESMSHSIKLLSFIYKYVEEHRCILVIDESSFIKNINAKRTQHLIYIAQNIVYKYILNGTPVTRDERDLFAQWYLLDWRILGYKSQYSFARNHVIFDKTIKNKVIGTKNVEYLARKIEPYTYQVRIEDMTDMPCKVYETRFFSLNEEQDYMYDLVAGYLIERTDDWKPETIYRLFNYLSLVSSGYVLRLNEQEDEIEKLAFLDTTQSNPRLAALKDTVSLLQGKIIIFCRYSNEIQAVTNMLNKQYGNGSAVTFYGETPLRERNKNILKFESNARFFVANKNCGGFSLNLQFCNQIIFYNNDWDFGTRKQAEDRTYRFGQDKKCLYVDIVASHTIEERILRCLERKEELAEMFKEEIKGNLKDINEIIHLRKKCNVKVEDDLVEKIY